MSNSYGNVLQNTLDSDIEKSLEELEILGYTIIDSKLSSEDLQSAIEISNELNKVQTKDYSESYLREISELNMVRAPLVHNEFFLEKIILNKELNSILKSCLGNSYQLHLQNIIINTPKEEHHQRSWHRDLPYQNYSTSKPISISAMLCLTEFNEETGGTEFLPYSHKLDMIPSKSYVNDNFVQPNVQAGQFVVFNSLVLHRAGKNFSNKDRIGVNNIFTTPIIKQQICLPEYLDGKYSDKPEAASILGYNFPLLYSDKDFKEYRKGKLGI